MRIGLFITNEWLIRELLIRESKDDIQPIFLTVLYLYLRGDLLRARNITQ